MDPRSREAIIRRWRAICGDTPCPTSWEQIGTVTEQLLVADADPVLAQILQGQIPADLEIQLLRGTLPQSYDGPTVQQQQDQAQAEALAEMTQRMEQNLEQMRARNAAMAAAAEASRAESVMVANAALAATGRQQRGW